MSEESIYNQLKELLAKAGGAYRIMEEQIDVDLQVEFFEMANKLLKQATDGEILLKQTNKLFDKTISVEDKKRMLVQLSNAEKPDAYRIIQQFIEEGDSELRPWAVLSLQHSRITLETHLLDENQVFISTGLGGDNSRLRYFIAIRAKYGKTIKECQRTIVHNEFEPVFKKNKSAIEEFSFYEKYFTIKCLIPIDVAVNDVVLVSIAEANQYGNFLSKDYLVTNVKILNQNEIENFFNKKSRIKP